MTEVKLEVPRTVKDLKSLPFTVFLEYENQSILANQVLGWDVKHIKTLVDGVMLGYDEQASVEDFLSDVEQFQNKNWGSEGYKFTMAVFKRQDHYVLANFIYKDNSVAAKINRGEIERT